MNDAMNISGLILRLNIALREHGDLPIAVYEISREKNTTSITIKETIIITGTLHDGHGWVLSGQKHLCLLP